MLTGLPRPLPIVGAMVDFAKAQSTWYATWPASDDDRALRMYVPSRPLSFQQFPFYCFSLLLLFSRVARACADSRVRSDYVKMWQLC